MVSLYNSAPMQQEPLITQRGQDILTASQHRGKVLGWAAATAIAALVAMGLWNTRGNLPEEMALTAHPEGIMGTQCTLTALVATDDAERAQRALSAAERALRRVEALMSTHLNAAEISRFNRPGPGELAPMSANVPSPLPRQT